MTDDEKRTMDTAERVEWLDHTTEWAQELADEAEGYALDCAANSGALLPLEDDFSSVAALARDLHLRVKRVLDAARAEAGVDG